MKSSRFTDARSVFIIQQGKEVMPVAEIYRKSEQLIILKLKGLAIPRKI